MSEKLDNNEMKTLGRFDLLNRLYFVTVVTYQREEMLLTNVQLFRDCWKQNHPIAWVILPDHFHAIVTIDNQSISDFMHNFKITYSRRYRDAYRKGRIWQNRFWDHIIRDQDDFNRHVDYIHFNPVRHKLVTDPFEYEHSSLTEYYKAGYYERDWGVMEPINIEGNFGE